MHAISPSIVLAAALIAGSTPAFGQVQARTSAGTGPAPALIEATAIPTDAVMTIDGRFDEAVWQRATVASGFLQREPDEGASTSHPTEVRVAYDAASLYVAVRSIDPEPDEIVGLLTRRDESSPSDRVAVLIDSFGDRRTAYEFAVNVAGVKSDRYWYNDTNNDQGWDAVWDVAVARTADGWQAEFRIGFSQLRFRGRDPGSIGFAVTRSVAHLNETSTWPLLARSANGYVSQFGQLRGVTIAARQRTLEVMPYMAGEVTTEPVAEGHPFISSPGTGFSGGLDLRYQVAPGLTLTGTINPDFGQVEADPAVVNLGAFETFFQERRPFFLEGAGNFEVRDVFYSRRIGRAPQRGATAPDGGYVDQPSNTTILGAAKLTGRVGNYAIGALTAVTAPEYARLATADGTPAGRTPVEPTTSYSIVRVSREFANQSRISILGTSTKRHLGDELAFLPSAAFSGGVDADLRFGPSGNYSLTPYWIGSHVRGRAEAIDRLQRNNVHSFQRPNASHLVYDPSRTTLNGHSGGVSFNKIGGQRVVFSSMFGYRSPGFEVNDLGFQSRADQGWWENWIQFKDETPGRIYRTFRFNINQWAGWTFGGERRNLGYNVNAHVQFVNMWGAGTGATKNLEAFDDRLTRGGPGGLVPGVSSAWAYIESDNRKPVSVYFEQGVFGDGHGSWDSSQWINTTIRPQTALSITLQLQLSRQRTARQWVENITDEGSSTTDHVFGSVRRRTAALGIRVNYTLSPTLSLQLFARPFVSSGDYDSFTRLDAPLAASFDDRFSPFAYDGNPDFNVHSFRSTNVLRWEYRPGSTLFVVWQQGREGFEEDGTFALGRDVRRMFHAPARNALLVKVSRWLNF